MTACAVVSCVQCARSHRSPTESRGRGGADWPPRVLALVRALRTKLKYSTRSTPTWRSVTRKVLAITVALALTVGALPFPLAQPAPALAAASCATSSPPSGAYTIELCFTSVTDGETVTGDRTITVSRTTVSGSPPLYNSLVYSLDNLNDPNDAPYLLTAFAAPFSFVLPTARFFKDGAYHLSVLAEMRDLNTLQGPTITVNLANGVVTPPGSGNSFAEVNGPATGPVVLAAVGDGPDGGL